MVTRRPGVSVGQKLVAHDAARVEIAAQERHRMRLQRQVQMAIVLDHLLARQHRRQMRRPAPAPACDTRANSGRLSLSPAFCKRLHRPQRVAAAEAERIEGIGVGELFQRLGRQAGAQPEIADGVEAARRAGFRFSWPILRRSRRSGEDRDGRACVVRMSPLIEAWRGCKRPCEAGALSSVQSQFGTIHIDRPHLDAMLLRIAHELRRGVKAHRLAVEQRRERTHRGNGI